MFGKRKRDFAVVAGVAATFLVLSACSSTQDEFDPLTAHGIYEVTSMSVDEHKVNLSDASLSLIVYENEGEMGREAVTLNPIPNNAVTIIVDAVGQDGEDLDWQGVAGGWISRDKL